MTIAQIKYFLSVLEHGSFSEAAEEMYISQSSFSKQIKNLETELGVALFLRSNAKVSLTPAGEIFEPHARLMDSTYNQLMGDMTSYKNSSAENTVTVAALPLLYEYGISDALCTFHESRDSVQVNVVETNQPDILTGLLSGRFDFAVLRLDYLDDEHFDIYPLVYDTYVLVCPKVWASRLGHAPIRFEDLTQEPIVLLGKDSDVYKRCMDTFERCKFTPKKVLTASRHTHFLQLVDSGCGIGFLPQGLVNLHMFPKLAVYPSPVPIETWLGLVRLKGRRLSTSAQELYDTITGQFA